jgi:hypothetical protein
VLGLPLCFGYEAFKEFAMSTLTFDTLEATRRLRDAGFDEKQAETVVRVLADAQDKLVTREHFDTKLESMEMRLTIKLGAFMAVAAGVIIAVLRTH